MFGGSARVSKMIEKSMMVTLICIAILATTVFPFPHQVAHADGATRSFPQQSKYAEIMKPNHNTQYELNMAVSTYYDYWKSKYLKKDLTSLSGGYYVQSNITGDNEGYTALGSSEGQGLGMIITVLMAGYDPDAQTIYNGLLKTAKTFRSSENEYLMGSIIADAISAQGHFSAAISGDLNIAYSLILAHNQWGSKGNINYLAEANNRISKGIKASTSKVDSLLGHWSDNELYYFVGDQAWINVINDSSFISTGTVNGSDQNKVNTTWNVMKNKHKDGISDSHNLLNMLYISGNGWVPSADTVPSMVNLAKDKPAISSTNIGIGFEASRAFDSNYMTRWASAGGNDPEWIFVDLGSVQSIHRVKLKWEDAYATQYAIQVSSDSLHWTDVYSTSNGDGGADEITFQAQSGRYVRLYCTAKGASQGYSVYEFEVY
ncbi:glycosyl hydrolase family 8 [Paenibacillus segetis]|uniref:F5/8 type C domain-containing protein n=1 Tax=Paenibacillus segetis TaxID=1325360 RepID=A0ABQ1YB52_9BACL|nr:glycosyl hydrolase family 8 [Paenibacillus segetis]GGH19501.1 hypothetical protein GCM10008013_16210 [Paenibacillus segetis]